MFYINQVYLYNMKHIIKKILREEFENFEWINEMPKPFNDWLTDNYPEFVNRVGLFLKDYENLTPHPKGDKIYYIDEQNKPIFYYHTYHTHGQHDHYCFFKFWGFWEVFEKTYGGYGMGPDEIKEVLEAWLKFTYGIKNLTPTFTFIKKENDNFGSPII